MVDERALTAAGLAVADMPGDPACIDIARAAIAAYEAAKPAPPMSTSGEMVEAVSEARYCWEVIQGQCSEGDGFTENAAYALEAAIDKCEKAASRIEALEALVAEQAGEIEKLRHIRDRRGDKIIELSERALSAEAALAKGGG